MVLATQLGASRSFKALQTTSISINSNGHRAQFIEEIISLEIELDSTFSWGPYIKHSTKKVNRVFFRLRFIRPNTTLTLRKRSIETLIMAHLDYCTIVYLDAPQHLRVRLQRLANDRVRYNFGLEREARSSSFRKRLGWMSTDMRREYFALLTMYRIIRMGEPPMLLPLFKRSYQTRPTRGIRKDLVV